MGQIEAREHDLIESAANPSQHAQEIVDDPARLPLDAVGQRRTVVVWIGRDLPPVTKTQPSAAVAWLYCAIGFGAPGNHQKFDHSRPRGSIQEPWRGASLSDLPDLV